MGELCPLSTLKDLGVKVNGSEKKVHDYSSPLDGWVIFFPSFYLQYCTMFSSTEHVTYVVGPTKVDIYSSHSKNGGIWKNGKS